MIILTVYKEAAGKKENREFPGLPEAIEFGQKTGCDYEIYDPVSGKVIDWNEINVREDDDWYYDEKEYLWKRLKSDDDMGEGYSMCNFHYEIFGQNRNLHNTGS